MSTHSVSVPAASAAERRVTPGTVAAEQAPRRPFYARIPAPWLFASLITLILVVGEALKGGLGGYERLPLSLGTAVALEIVLSRLLRRRWPHPLSAYITGNSVAILVKPLAVWPIAVTAAISIVSKYCLSFRGQHLWNPSNFGIAIMLLIAPGSMAVLSHEWGNDIVTFAIVFAIGMVVVSRAKLLHVSGTYALAFVAFTAVRTVLPGADSFWTELAAVTGPMYLLFIFFMITDPKTIVRGKQNQVLVTVIIAAVECGMRVAGNNDAAWVQPFLPAPPLFALAIVGPLALVVQMLHRGADRRAPAPTIAPAARPTP